MFDQYIILDLEMNPVEKRNWEARALLQREVIEIGAVRLDASYKVVDRFSLFVKPAYSRNVAAFITELTGIKTFDLARAVDFKTALEALSAWIGEIPACIYSWSDNDLVQLRRECAYKNIEMPSNMEAWVDAQPLYPALLN